MGAVHAPLLRLVITHRDEVVPALPPAPRREVLAAVLSLARDADQPQLWTWLAADPQTGLSGRAGQMLPPPCH